MSPYEEIEAAPDEYQARSRAATAAGVQAFARLLQLAEQRDSGQIERVVHFLAATYNGQAFQSCSAKHDWNNAKRRLMRSEVLRRQSGPSIRRSGCGAAASHSHSA